MKRLALALISSLVLAMPLAAAASGPQLARGVGVHEWLNWSPLDSEGNYKWPPYIGIETWLSGARPLSDWPPGDQFDRIREMGFDFVRLSIDPGPLLSATGARRQEALDVLEAAIRHVSSRGLSVVVDLHAVSQKPEYSRASLETPDGARRYRDMVVDVAERLTVFSPDSIAFEPYNEPAFYPCDAGGTDDWQDLLSRTVADIRAGSTEMTIIATGACGGGVVGLVDLEPTFDDPNIRYSFHMYKPHSFTHQQAANPGEFSSGLPWPASRGWLGEALDDLKNRMDAAGVDESRQILNLIDFRQTAIAYFRENEGEAELQARFAEAVAWAEAHGIPSQRLFMGEFGTILMSRDGRKGARNEDRLRYLGAVRAEADRYGIPWAIWEYSNPYGMSLILPDGAANPDPDLIDILGLNP